jgi:hypothetical protein
MVRCRLTDLLPLAWPVRGPEADLAKATTKPSINEAALRAEVRARIARILSAIIQRGGAAEVVAMLGNRRPGRPPAA